MKGWHKESGRHALAARGVRTTIQSHGRRKTSKIKNPVRYEVIIGTDGRNENGVWGVRYDSFLITIDKIIDDKENSWYRNWEGGASEILLLPDAKEGYFKVEHTETWGDDVDHNLNSTWTEEFHSFKRR